MMIFSTEAAKSAIIRRKLATFNMALVLLVSGCSTKIPPTINPDVSPTKPVAAEVIHTETATATESPTLTPTATEIPLPAEISEFISKHPEFKWQNGNLFYDKDGQTTEIPLQINFDGIVAFKVNDLELTGQIETHKDGHIVIIGSDGNTYTIENGIVETVYTGIGGDVFITNTELQKISSRIDCTSALGVPTYGCFQEGEPINAGKDAFHFRFVSSGQAENVVVDASGKKVTLTLLYAVSKNDQTTDYGIVVPILAQAVMENETKSVESAYGAWLMWYLNTTLQEWPEPTSVIISLDQLVKASPQGTLFQAYIPYEKPTASWGGNSWPAKYLFGIEGYANSVNQFWQSKGKIVDKKLILWPNGWDNPPYWW